MYNLKIPAVILLMTYTLAMKAQEIKIFPDGFITDKNQYTEKVDTTLASAGGKPIRLTFNVAEPTIRVYKSANAQPAAPTILVCPGGAYQKLSMDSEGSEVCEMLNANGYHAVLLKYRVPRRPNRAKHEAPLEDAQRAMSYVRAHAAEWGIGAGELGIMGFSAGGHLSAMTANSERTYKPTDKIDTYSCKPDFCVLIYPAYLSAANFSLAPEVKISKNTPETFILQSQDDVNYVDSSIFYLYALKQMGIPATLHILPNGGHGYGMRKCGTASDGWEQYLLAWLDSR